MFIFIDLESKYVNTHSAWLDYKYMILVMEAALEKLLKGLTKQISSSSTKCHSLHQSRKVKSLSISEKLKTTEVLHLAAKACVIITGVAVGSHFFATV